ncbi:hypothetical protein [Thalassobius sp. MITS945101]|uniref:hypothetical protein n=1 Tax=Thalassobius sp. MITS945101 TaxID=3096994 RepID=UPI00399A0599
MPLSYQIFADQNLNVVRYQGYVRAEETLEVFYTYLEDPDFQPNQLQLVDLTHVTGAQVDLEKMLAMQAEKVKRLLPNGGRIQMMVLAPNDVSRAMASLVQKSWEPFPADVMICETSQADALRQLGVESENFATISTP